MASPGEEAIAVRLSKLSLTSKDSSTLIRNNEPTKQFTFQELDKITDNCSKDRFLGQGGFATVYKGVLDDGEEIAVKYLHNSEQTDKDFNREFDIIRKLNHPNIVRLVAYSFETQHQPRDFRGQLMFGESIRRALSFEFMRNGSLQEKLSDESHGLDWKECYKIIKGACEGLKYLHGLSNPIFHLDLKPDNILLDENMTAKLADFGVSKRRSTDQTMQTQNVSGTIAYMAPEYLHYKVLSNKADVFSMGVVIAQMIGGREWNKKMDKQSKEEFREQVQVKWWKRLEANYDNTPNILRAYYNQVVKCMEIALISIEDDWKERPTIAEIVDILDKTEEKINWAISHWKDSRSSVLLAKSQREKDEQLLKVEAFTRNKAIHAKETCDKFPVLVRLTGPPHRRTEEAACPGVDVVVVVNHYMFTTALLELVDRLSPNDRLSISSSRSRFNRPIFTPLMDMSDQCRDDVRLKMDKLAESNGGFRQCDDTDLAGAAKILRQRGVEESGSRAGCILLLWRAAYFVQMHKEISREFPVHILYIEEDSPYNYEVPKAKHIADMTGGTCTHFKYHTRAEKSLALFFDSIASSGKTAQTSIRYWSVGITLRAEEGVTISSIESGRYANLVCSNKQSATVHLRNIYAGQRKSFIVYLTVPQEQEKLLTIASGYPGRDKLVTVDVSVQRPCWDEIKNHEVAIHPKVAAQLLRIRLMEGIAKGNQDLQLVWNEIKNSDDGRAAPEEILSDLGEEVAEMTDRSRADKEAMLSSLSCHQLQQPSTTDQNIHAFQILDQQREDEHTRMVEVKVFTRSKGIVNGKACGEFPVLVRVTVAPWRLGCEMPRDGVDVVAVLDISENMQAESLVAVKQAMMIMVDKLGPDDRLSILSTSSQTRTYQLMELMYMSDDQRAMYEISHLSVSGRCTGHTASAALQEGAQILREHGAEESSRRLGCMMLLSDGNYPEILQTSIMPEFPVHTFGLGADHNPEVMKYIADKTCGTYSFVNQDISSIKDAVGLFITGLTSIALTSMKITLWAHRRTAIKSIESGNYVHQMGSGTIIIDHIYAGEQKEFIVNLNVGADIKDLMTIGGQYKCLGRDYSIAEMKISVRRPSTESSPEDLAIHPDVAAALMRVRLQNGVLDMVEKQTWSEKGVTNLWEMIEASDEGRAATDKTLEAIKDETWAIATHCSGIAYALSSLSGHMWQRETTKDRARSSTFFRTIGQYTDTNMVKLETFTRSKAILSDDQCNKFPVLVRFMVTPQQHAEEMPCAGVDVVAVLDASEGMRDGKLEHMKEAMMVVIDKLRTEDRLSIVSFNTYENRLTRLSYMTEHSRDVARLKINNLVASGQGDITAALREGAEILCWRGLESTRRVGCIVLLSDCKNSEISGIGIRPEFPVHTFGLGADHNPNIMKNIADITSGTYSFVNQDIGMIKEALTVFINNLTSVAAMSIKITIRANEGITISSIESGGYVNHVENNQFGMIDMDNIYASEHKDFIVYVSMAEGKKELITIGGRYLSHDTVKHLAYTDVFVERPHHECLPDDLAFQPEVAAELVRIKLEKDMLAMLDKEPSSVGLQQLWEKIMDTDEGRATPAETLSGISMEVAEMKRDIENSKEYRKSGLPYTLSWLTSRRWRRATIKGTPSNSDAFQTTGQDEDGRATLSQ